MGRAFDLRDGSKILPLLCAPPMYASRAPTRRLSSPKVTSSARSTSRESCRACHPDPGRQYLSDQDDESAWLPTRTASSPLESHPLSSPIARDRETSIFWSYDEPRGPTALAARARIKDTEERGCRGALCDLEAGGVGIIVATERGQELEHEPKCPRGSNRTRSLPMGSLRLCRVHGHMDRERGVERRDRDVRHGVRLVDHKP